MIERSPHTPSRRGGGGGRREGGTYYISMGRDVSTKGSYFQSLSGTEVCFIVKNLGRDSNIPV